METEVRICGRKLFHQGVWRVLIDGCKWLYDENNDSFIRCYDRFMGYNHLWVICGDDFWDVYRPFDGPAMVSKKDMPIPVQVGFYYAWENNKLILHERYSHRHSYAWQIFIGNLQMRHRNFVVCSRGRRMGLVELVDEPKNSLTN